MQKFAVLSIFTALSMTSIAHAQESKAPTFPSPNAIVDQAATSEWRAIAANDLLIMDLTDSAAGDKRRVIIQLMPPPFSQGWIGNIRKLAKARWWDGTSVNRVQDNYVVQWGDASEKKALPEDLVTVPGADYAAPPFPSDASNGSIESAFLNGAIAAGLDIHNPPQKPFSEDEKFLKDRYAAASIITRGWPLGMDGQQSWPIHCYGAVGVGRGYSPDTGSGAELYTVIGHAPRHLDRNIAVVGRIIEGIEHLSSLPRGTGPLGFYEKAEQRVAIQAIRLASDLVAAEQPHFEYLDTDSASFAGYAYARANRKDPFFIKPAGGADICNIPVPVRRVKEE